LGKAGNKTFDFASQRFFWAGDKFPARVITKAFAARGAANKHEQTLRFIEKRKRFCACAAALS
jgi:hypothetical protein